MNIGIIGAGTMGRILAHGFCEQGHRVCIANSRGPRTLTAVAAETGATAVTVIEAAQAGGVVVLAIPTRAVPTLPGGLFVRTAGTVVVDIGNYHPELRDGRIAAIDGGMPDSQWVAQQIGRPVIKAFNNIYAQSLQDRGCRKGMPGRIGLSVAGDAPNDKATVCDLIDELGFDPVNGGTLDDSWRQQTGTPAYCQDLDAAALRDALARAERRRVAEYRTEQEARIRKSMAV
ncbi:MAG: NAD(P)-binding domain-containing protein [Phycisphaerales bacterium]